MSLVEVLVALSITALIFVGFLNVFDTTSRLSKAQMSIADMTESMRFGIAELERVTRMSGSGGLPLVTAETNSTLSQLAIVVTDNRQNIDTMPEHFQFQPTPAPILNSDIITFRGVITSPLYDLSGDPVNPSVVDLGSGNYSVTIQKTSPTNNQGQPAVTKLIGTAFVVAQIGSFPYSTSSGQSRVYGRSSIGVVYQDVDKNDGNPTFQVFFTSNKTTLSRTDGSDFDTTETIELNPNDAFSIETPMAVTAGFADKVTYYVGLNPTGQPSLYRFSEGSMGPEEIVPNVADLQIALGLDLNGDGFVFENGFAPNDDEWFYNQTGDNDPTGAQFLALREMRFSLVGRGNS
ncbi:MAG: hypothetical protein GY906_00165, partial [bacterium]|nr:hypothetical protein [bacterium]